MRTAVGHGSVDPKRSDHRRSEGARSVEELGRAGLKPSSHSSLPLLPGGDVAPPIERESGRDSRTGTGTGAGASGDASEPGDADGGPGESSLFFLTAPRGPLRSRHPTAPESDRPEMGPEGRQSASGSEASGTLPSDRENPGESPPFEAVFPPGRTHNRIRSPR
jgi:hypothetical protein